MPFNSFICFWNIPISEPKYFSARGYGEYKPIVPNTNEENRSKNRRVEVLILPNYDIEDEVEKHEET